MAAMPKNKARVDMSITPLVELAAYNERPELPSPLPDPSPLPVEPAPPVGELEPGVAVGVELFLMSKHNSVLLRMRS